MEGVGDKSDDRLFQLVGLLSPFLPPFHFHLAHTKVVYMFVVVYRSYYLAVGPLSVGVVF